MFEVYRIAEDGTKTLVNNTEVDTASISVVYDVLSQKATSTLDEYVTDGSIMSVDKATMVAQVINNVINQSVMSVSQQDINSVKILAEKNKLDLDIKLKEYRLYSASMDNDTKQQKLLQEQQKNGNLSFEYVFFKSYIDKAGNKTNTELITESTITVDDIEYVLFKDYRRVQSKVLKKVGGISNVELANIKMIEDTNFIKTQNAELIKSVIYNNKIKAGDSLSDLYGTLGQGGLIIPDIGWTVLFDIIADITGIKIELDEDDKIVFADGIIDNN